MSAISRSCCRARSGGAGGSGVSLRRSISPSGSLSSPPDAAFFQRSAYSSSPASTTIQFASPGRSFSAPSLRDVQTVKHHSGGGAASGTAGQKRRTCACSPSMHPGSFRCGLHRASAIGGGNAASSSSSRSALVGIGRVESEWVRRALAAIIRPSSLRQRRRAGFQPRPSRLSVMSKVDDLR